MDEKETSIKLGDSRIDFVASAHNVEMTIVTLDRRVGVRCWVDMTPEEVDRLIAELQDMKDYAEDANF